MRNWWANFHEKGHLRIIYSLDSNEIIVGVDNVIKITNLKKKSSSGSHFLQNEFWVFLRYS